MRRRQLKEILKYLYFVCYKKKCKLFYYLFKLTVLIFDTPTFHPEFSPAEGRECHILSIRKNTTTHMSIPRSAVQISKLWISAEAKHSLDLLNKSRLFYIVDGYINGSIDDSCGLFHDCWYIFTTLPFQIEKSRARHGCMRVWESSGDFFEFFLKKIFFFIIIISRPVATPIRPRPVDGAAGGGRVRPVYTHNRISYWCARANK